MKNWEWYANQYLTNVRKSASEGVRAAAIWYQARVKEYLNTLSTGRDQPTQSTPGGPPGKRSGALGRSIVINREHVNDRERPRAYVGTNLRYAWVHEFGGTINAKNVKYLTIPLNNQARRMRRMFRSLRDAAVGGARSWVRTKSGRKFLYVVPAAREGSSGARAKSPRPRIRKPAIAKKKQSTKYEKMAVFVLKESVTIPARPFMRPTYDHYRGDIQRIIADRARLAFERRR